MKQTNWYKLGSIFLGVILGGVLLTGYCSAAGELIVSPLGRSVDNLIGATNAQWVFTGTTTQALSRNDVVQITFPTVMGPLGVTNWSFSNATIATSTGISLKSSLGGSLLSNLVVNPSFEGGNGNWILTVPSASSSALAITKTNIPHGSKIMQVEVGADERVRVRQNILVATNTLHTMSFYTKAGTSTGEGRFFLTLDAGPANCDPGKALTYNFTTTEWQCLSGIERTDVNYYSATSSLSSYNRHSVSFITPSISPTLQYAFYVGGSVPLIGSKVQFDAVQVEVGGTATAFNLGGIAPDINGVVEGGPTMLYGYIATNTPAGTFSFRIGGVNNPSGTVNSLAGNKTWNVKAGLPTGSPTSTLAEEKFNANDVDTIIRGGGSLVVDQYTGLFISNTNTSSPSNYTFRFTPTSSVPIGSKIVLEFPVQYANLLNGISVSTTQPISILNTTTSTVGALSTSTANTGGRRVTVIVGSQDVAPGDPLSITIYGVINPPTAGVFGSESAGAGQKFAQYITRSNNGLLDGSLNSYGDQEFSEGMGPPPPSSVIIGGHHTINLIARVVTPTTTRNLNIQERNLLQVVAGNEDKGYFLGAKRINNSSAAQYTGLLNGTYRVGTELLNRNISSNYDALLTPGMKSIPLLSTTPTTVTTTLFFAIPDATTTIALTGGVPGQNASILAQSADYMSFTSVYTDQTYNTQGFANNGNGYAKIKVKSGQDWSFNVMGEGFGQNTNFSSGTVKFWPPSINKTHIATTGTIDLGSYAYVQADRNLVVTLLYAGSATPVTNACVGVKRSGGGFFMGEQDMTCQSNGTGANINKYVFKVPAGAISISINRPGGGLPDEYPVSISSATTTKSIYLSSNSTYINIRVKDSDDNSIRNASVYARKINGSEFSQGMTGSVGSTTLYLSPGTYIIEGSAPGFGALSAQQVTITEGANMPSTFTVNSASLGTVTGAVRQGGTGLVGVKIGAYGTGATSGGNSTETTEGGVYTLYLPAGTYQMSGWSSGTGGLSSQPVTVVAGEQTGGVNWSLGVEGTLRVIVNNASEVSPLFAGAFNVNTGKGNFSDSWTTSGTTKFTDITLPAGLNVYRVNVGSPVTGPIISEQIASITAGERTTVTGDAHGSATLITLSGSATLDSVGISNVNIWASQFGSPKFYSTQTDAVGNYTLQVPADGNYRIGIKAIGYISEAGDEQISVTSTNYTKDFILNSATSIISGQVTSSGTAVTDAWVSAKKTISGNEVWTGSPTDADGYYSLNVDSGTWTIFAEGPGYERSTGTSTTPGGTANISLTARLNWSAPIPFVQGITDSSGGQVTTYNTTLSLPENSLGSNNAVVTVTVVTTTPRMAPNATALKNSTISISASNSSGQSITSLGSNADLTVSLNADDLTELKIAESDLQFAYFDETTGQWEPMAATIDTTNHTVTVQTDHFTDFAPVIGGPDAPIGLTLATTTAEQIDLSWSSPVATTTYYMIYATTTAISAFPTSTFIASTTNRTYSHSGLTAGDIWYYKVAGVNDVGEGPNSDRANATVAANASGVTITQSSGETAVTEGGATDLYTIVLDSAPSANVTITLSASADLSLSTSSIIFTTSNWNSAVTVTVTATDDFSVEDSESASITHNAVSSDLNYNGISISSVTVTITDNDYSGGGAADNTPPTNTSILVNSSASTTASVNVTLILGATDVSYMMIANESGFTSSTWETYVTSKSWILNSGLGLKTVYAKFKDASGNISIAISDTIELVSSTVFGTTPTTTSTTTTVTDTSVVSSTVDVSQTAKMEVVKMFSFSFTKDLSLGAQNSEAKELQKALKELGYFTYPTATGYFGSITQTAVANYQKAKGLTQTGKLDLATRNSLNSLTKEIASLTTSATTVANTYQFKNQLQVGVNNNEVSELQKILKTLGHFTYPSITGYFGTVTKEALMAYQKIKGVTQSGILDLATRNLLNGVVIDSTDTTANAAISSGVTSGYVFKSFLFVGSIGEEVKQLQTKLKTLGYFTYPTITGVYGSITAQAVKDFQKANSIDQFGYVGPMTRGALNKP